MQPRLPEWQQQLQKILPRYEKGEIRSSLQLTKAQRTATGSRYAADLLFYQN